MKTRSKSLDFKRRLAVLAACFFALGQAQADSLWAKETAISLFADHKANRVGDIITVLVMESNSASRNSSTKTEKKSDISASISNFINGNFQDKPFPGGGANVQKPKLGTTSQSKFEGKGAVNNSGSLNSRFAVRVVDVLPNKNLIIRSAPHFFLRGKPDDCPPGHRSTAGYNTGQHGLQLPPC